MKATIVSVPASVSMQKGKALRAILQTWSNSDLLEMLNLDHRELIERVIEEASQGDLDNILRDPRYAKIREANLLDENLEMITLCGGAKSPEEERAAYERALRGE